MQSKHLKWYLLIILSITWGSSFILIKRGLVGLTPFQLGSLRIIFCALFLLIVGFKSLRNIPRGKWKYLAITALFGTFLPVYLFSIAQTEIHSSITAILNSLTPLGTLIIGAAVFGLSFQKRQLFGVLIGLVGCALLVFKGAIDNPNQNYYYTLYVVVAALCYSVNINLVKKYLSDVSPLSISTGNFAVIILPALAILFSSGFADVVTQPETQNAMLYVAVLGIVGTGIANIIFFKLIHISSPIFTSSVTYMIPVVAFGWGLFDGESLSPLQVLGAAIILLGVYFSSKKVKE
ncbi:DMT family transporter [Flavobacterium arcticum]|uniref:DMT family transporter n=1 Tax=Flavobacterium arcticum TaxID=1784713 RepID=A0A345HBZ4_9FLAO|nr:DMT family transporter [Flavobacterium arcticum]AXG74104.1 DMT family transporter [Flavobacterium arcticum]KAF2507337.1 DMT family transporter [Flavobacterium arcticum]